jgi:hypothetical protein
MAKYVKNMLNNFPVKLGKKHGKVTVTRGQVHDYLGIELDY